MMSEIRLQRQQMENLKERDRQKQVEELQKQIQDLQLKLL